MGGMAMLLKFAEKGMVLPSKETEELKNRTIAKFARDRNVRVVRYFCTYLLWKKRSAKATKT